jgi:hypothetical protein
MPTFLSLRCKNNIKIYLKKIRSELNSSGLGEAGYFEHGNEPSDSIERQEISWPAD